MTRQLTVEQAIRDPEIRGLLKDYYEEKVAPHFELDIEYYEDMLDEQLAEAGFEYQEASFTYNVSHCQGDGVAFTAKWDPAEQPYRMRRSMARKEGTDAPHTTEISAEGWAAILETEAKHHTLREDYLLMYLMYHEAAVDFSVGVDARHRYGSPSMTLNAELEDLAIAQDFNSMDITEFEEYYDADERVFGTYELDYAPSAPPQYKIYAGAELWPMMIEAEKQWEDFIADVKNYCDEVASEFYRMMSDDIMWHYSDEAFDEWLKWADAFDIDTVLHGTDIDVTIIEES